MSSMTTAEPAATTRRMSSEERRDQILLAAIAVFGARGYEGTTTDEVARAAGVSQPYVVRLFGSKESLFLAALAEALDRLLASFRAALLPGESTEALRERVGDAYVGLLAVRGLHQTLSHAFLLGGHPVIGPRARAGFAQVWAFFREEVGLSREEAHMFLAKGMLINTMIGLRLASDLDSDRGVKELFDECFPTALSQVLDVAPRATEPW
jgi:AcrR family transcriptional regulator